MIDYQYLNERLADTLFKHEFANKPVYVMLEDEHKNDLSKHLNIDEKDVEGLILELASKQIQIDPAEKYFSTIARQIFAWEKECKKSILDGTKPPVIPHLPILVSLVIAASDMSSEGGYHPNAYYPRLTELLQIKNRTLLEEGYRAYARTIWSSLNFWLDDILQGKFGIGTAYSISNRRYVGFALSQALIRSVDRKKLPLLFRENQLPPFSNMIERDMEVLIDHWVDREDSFFSNYRNPSQPFKSLWKKADARNRISNVICHELELWDGSTKSSRQLGSQESENDYSLKLEAHLSSFPRPTLSLNFALNTTESLPSDGLIQIVSKENNSNKSIKTQRTLVINDV